MPKAKDIQDEAIEQPTIDPFMDRDPKLLTDEDFEQLIAILRGEHKVFVEEEQRKKDK